MKKIIYIIASIMISVVAIACNSLNTEEIVLSKKYLTVCNTTAQEWADSLDKGTYTNYSLREDGALIIRVTEQQRKALKDKTISKLQNYVEQFEARNNNYHIDISDDCRNADFYYNREVAFDSNTGYSLTVILRRCALYQIENGCPEDDWAVNIRIFDCDSGKLIFEGTTKTGVNYDVSDWE